MNQDNNQTPAAAVHGNRDMNDNLDHNLIQGQEQEQEQEQEEEYDRYKDNPELLGETKSKATRMFSYDWANGFVSPFRPTPHDILRNMLQHVDFSTTSTEGGGDGGVLLDLGCGDGLVLVQALETFPRSKLSRAIGVDLDQPLLEAARDRIQQEHPSLTTASALPGGETTAINHQQHDILSRLELYHGDLTAMHDSLTTIMAPASRQLATNPVPATMNALINDSSHLFVYLLPVALSKLAPLLLDAMVTKHKIILSMRWEIPELSEYLAHGGETHQFYIYQCNKS
ncbi:hypothetical protein EC991_002254 [Linnemannia zychae]|nr:hypothetical protein EC991_002254 [Linnemannia zychae]